MNTPVAATRLEQALRNSGDLLYRLALVAGGERQTAERLLLALGSDLAGSSAPAAPPELDLPARLVHLARQQSPPSRQRPAAPNGPALFRSLLALPLEQRMAIALHLLAGYDSPRLAQSLGYDLQTARTKLVEAVRALGPGTGTSLTDRISDEGCAPVRELLADPSAGSRERPAVRNHLAGCSLCRNFDQGWNHILPAVETALREALRSENLPDGLRARMLAAATPKPRRRSLPLWPLARLALAPLAVLALIVALALPGWLTPPVRIIDRADAPPVDGKALIAQALAQQFSPPERSGIWYRRYATLWYFDHEVYAPLTAEIWLDPGHAARHRLQLSHRSGGAPYELQVGDGRGRLSYALDAAYAPALYNGLPVGATPGSPALADQPLDPQAQIHARDERLQTGPWTIAVDYLRQAEATSTLQLLGRQFEGNRELQILAFSGTSPLGLPTDAADTDAERVTILLALDSASGLLLRATELGRFDDTPRVSRVTWELLDEQWIIGSEQIRTTFAIERAWTGIGDFREIPRVPAADPALPLILASSLIDPFSLLTQQAPLIWMPAKAPPGVERALLIGAGSLEPGTDRLSGLVYLGTERSLIIDYGSENSVSRDAPLIGATWYGDLSAERTRLYRISLSQPGEAAAAGEPAELNIQARGFTRDELRAIIADLVPLNLESLQAQAELFAT